MDKIGDFKMNESTAPLMVLEFYVSIDGIDLESPQQTLTEWCQRFSKAIKTTDAVIPIEDGDKFRFRFSSGDTATFRKGAHTTATILQTIANRPAGHQFVQGEYSR